MIKKVNKLKWLIGIDEVGRGPLAGPVCLCACKIKYEDKNRLGTLFPGINDSKQLKKEKREELFNIAQDLKGEKQIDYIISMRSAKKIDTKGIGVCIKECVKEILEKVNVKPNEALILLDGSLYAPQEFIFQKTIIKGDAKEKIISLASIIAKVTRDKYMKKVSKKHPKYGFEKHVGYGTRYHRTMIMEHGTCVEHRISFLSSILKK